MHEALCFNAECFLHIEANCFLHTEADCFLHTEDKLFSDTAGQAWQCPGAEGSQETTRAAKISREPSYEAQHLDQRLALSRHSVHRLQSRGRQLYH